VLVAQISDTHICRAGELYKGVSDSNGKLRDAIAHFYRLDLRPDLVLLTGDIACDGAAEEYDVARELLRELTIPLMVIPGNHDDREAFRAAFSDHEYLPKAGPLHYAIYAPPLRIIGLDSSVPGKHHGAIEPLGLEWLAATLAADTTTPTLVMMHHPPFVSGIPYMDPYRYIEDDVLGSLLGRFANIEAVLCGHVHRPMIRRWAGTVVMACPSTTTEIALQLQADAKPQSFQGPSACMLHLWNPEVGLVSHTSYIGKYPGPYPFF
jgi:3',5'-cyclic AMP phosphodiesterase CpdA